MKRIQMLLMASLMSCIGHETPVSDCNRLFLYPELSRKKIRLSDSLKVFDGEPIKDAFNKAATIITVIQSDCPVCVQELISWKEYLRLNPMSESVNFYIVAIGGVSEYFSHQMKKLNLPFKVFVDYRSAFIVENDIPEMISEHTLILDPDQRIVFIGSPVLNPNCAEAFHQHISQLTK